jgi:hypothetical protein
MEGLFEISRKILTFQNKIYCRGNPRFARENTKKKKQKNGIIVTIHDNKNIA